MFMEDAIGCCVALPRESSCPELGGQQEDTVMKNQTGSTSQNSGSLWTAYGTLFGRDPYFENHLHDDLRSRSTSTRPPSAERSSRPKYAEEGAGKISEPWSKLFGGLFNKDSAGSLLRVALGLDITSLDPVPST